MALGWVWGGSTIRAKRSGDQNYIKWALNETPLLSKRNLVTRNLVSWAQGGHKVLNKMYFLVCIYLKKEILDISQGYFGFWCDKTQKSKFLTKEFLTRNLLYISLILFYVYKNKGLFHTRHQTNGYLYWRLSTPAVCTIVQ